MIYWHFKITSGGDWSTELMPPGIGNDPTEEPAAVAVFRKRWGVHGQVVGIPAGSL